MINLGEEIQNVPYMIVVVLSHLVLWKYLIIEIKIKNRKINSPPSPKNNIAGKYFRSHSCTKNLHSQQSAARTVTILLQILFSVRINSRT